MFVELGELNMGRKKCELRHILKDHDTLFIRSVTM